MNNNLVQILDPDTKISVLSADCLSAADALARGHLCGQTAAVRLAQALAAVSLLGAETSQPEETVTLRLECPGPLSGFLVEATVDGTLRGYTKKKILNDFDGLGPAKDTDIFGESGTFEIIRSIPGSILSSGAVAVSFGKKQAVATGVDAYFAQSLQRRVRSAFTAAAGDDGVPTAARGLLVECPPDGDVDAFARVSESFDSGTAVRALAASASLSPRALLKKIGLPGAEIRKTSPLSFACRCSRERAAALLATLPPEERESLPETVDITCHMCGRTWSVAK